VPKSLYIGVDVGTTAIKAAAYSAFGEQVASTRHGVTIDRPDDGFSEIDMEELWQIVVTCLRDIAQKIDISAVKSIGVCGQGDGLWMLDQDMRPVRPAILWNDARASDCVRDWTQDGTSDRINVFCRTAIWAGTAGAALRWVQDNEPDAFARAAHILFAKDWIVWNLTGQLATDLSDATIPFMNLETKSFAPEVFDALGLPDLSDRLPEIRSATDQAGVLTADLGLPPVPVCVGSIDLAAMLTGVGLTAPGDMCLILGTTAVVTYIFESEPFSEPSTAATLHHPFTNDWLRVFAPQSGASAFDWFAALHPNSFAGANAAEVAQKINTDAKDVPPGANGVMFLPFLTGERAPFVAPDATASFLGMRATTTKADLARAVMEGASFSLRHCLSDKNAPTPEQVVLTGGGARNALWCQIVADVLGVTILANDGEDHGLWGAAILGGACIGDLDPTHARRDEAFRTYTPDADAHATYSRLFQAYLTSIEASRTIWSALRT